MRPGEDFDAFYAAAFARIVGQVALVTGDRAEAEDVAQEAFTRAAVRWSRLREYDRPEVWVRRVALNLAVNRARGLRRRLRAHARAGFTPPPAGISEEAVMVATALRALNPAQRQAVVLHHLLGLSVEEVARQARVPVGTVKSRLARARRALAAELGDLEEVATDHARPA
jgi:RNA polymerase sigma-70 factor, ECF subfamily